MTLDLRESVCIPLFVHGVYLHQTAEDDFVRIAVQKGTCVFDVGANIGYYTRLLSRLVGEDGMVVALEPMPRALRLLRRNVADLPNVSVMPVAIGESNDLYADLREAAKLDVSSVAFGTTGSTPVLSIDSLAATVKPPAFVKIDVEGAELPALRGAHRVLSQIKPIVMFEYIPSTATCYGASHLQDLLDCFAGGYNFFRIGKPLRLLPVNSTETDNNNYAAIPNDAIGRFRHLIGPPANYIRTLAGE